MRRPHKYIWCILTVACCLCAGTHTRHVRFTKTCRGNNNSHVGLESKQCLLYAPLTSTTAFVVIQRVSTVFLFNSPRQRLTIYKSHVFCTYKPISSVPKLSCCRARTYGGTKWGHHAAKVTEGRSLVICVYSSKQGEDNSRVECGYNEAQHGNKTVQTLV